MKMLTKPIFIFFVFLAYSVIFLNGCSLNEKQKRVEYKKGFDDGRKEVLKKYEGIDPDLARSIIEDQQESQARIEDLINGRVNKMEIKKVDNNGQSALLDVDGVYKNGKKIDGTLEFLYKDGYWYLVTTFETNSEENN